MEARKFENKLKELGITYAQYHKIDKMWRELTQAGKMEVENLLKEETDTKLEKKMTNAVKNLLNPDNIVVFDCDGCLCVYEMGETKHMAVNNNDWQEYVKSHKPYDTAMSIPQVQRFIKDKGVENVYVCSKAFTEDEEEQKRSFIHREYNIDSKHIFFVKETSDKINVLKEIASERCDGDENKVAMVEDTVATIDAICETSDFLTLHISSFFTY
jgi:hypothetical protein